MMRVSSSMQQHFRASVSLRIWSSVQGRDLQAGERPKVDTSQAGVGRIRWMIARSRTTRRKSQDWVDRLSMGHARTFLNELLGRDDGGCLRRVTARPMWTCLHRLLAIVSRVLWVSPALELTTFAALLALAGIEESENAPDAIGRLLKMRRSKLPRRTRRLARRRFCMFAGPGRQGHGLLPGRQAAHRWDRVKS